MRSVNANTNALGSPGSEMGKLRDRLESVVEIESEKVLNKNWSLDHRLECVCFEKCNL